MARKVEEINAGSMADIAFLLLIFFLMATTMNVDSGLSRLLPPMPDPHQKNNDDVQVKERNVFIVLVNKYDQLLVNGQPLDVHMLREKTKEFVNNPAENPNLSERKLEEIKGLGQWPVSKGVVSLQNDRGTSYEMYMAIKNINPKMGQFKGFIEKGKEKIIEYYNSQCDVIIKGAQALAGQRKYEEAIFNLSAVPDVCRECYDRCMDLSVEIYKQYEDYSCWKTSSARSTFGMACAGGRCFPAW